MKSCPSTCRQPINFLWIKWFRFSLIQLKTLWVQQEIDRVLDQTSNPLLPSHDTEDNKFGYKVKLLFANTFLISFWGLMIVDATKLIFLTNDTLLRRWLCAKAAKAWKESTGLTNSRKHG